MFEQHTEDSPEALKADITRLYEMNTDLTNEIVSLRAALVGCERMLTIFENAWCEEKAKVRALTKEALKNG